MKEEATYNSFERNSYHFRKRLPHRHLLHYNKDTMYRISLRKVAKSFYHILVKDKNKLNQLTRYINRRVTVFLELQGKVTLDQISEFIFSICNEYRDEFILATKKDITLFYVAKTYFFKAKTSRCNILVNALYFENKV